MAEQLICNQQVDGSTPFTSSIYGSVPERPKGADCKSVVSDFGGPNPPAPTNLRKLCFRIFPFGKTKRVDSEGRPCPRQGKRQPCGLSLARGLPHCFRSVRARVDVRTIHPLPPRKMFAMQVRFLTEYTYQCKAPSAQITHLTPLLISKKGT